MRALAMMTPGHSLATVNGKDRHDPDHGRMRMPQMRITKQRRTARVGGRGQAEPEFPLDLRDPDIVRAKQLRRPREDGPGHRTAIVG